MSRATDIAYEKIKHHVLSGEAEPGTQLTEEQLARISGVSRTPVREAVRRLETELLIVRSDSKRLFVADWSSSDMEEMFTLRAMLEAHAAARAATRISSDQIKELEATSKRLEKAVAKEKPDVDSFLRENRVFHEVILVAARSPRLSAMLPMLIEQPVVHRTAHRYTRDELDLSIHDHRQLMAAFRARDGDWARAVMTSHIRRAARTFSTTVRGHHDRQERAND